MFATLNIAIITGRIIITFLQELAIVRAIIVERNLHAYYKLPAKPTQSIPQEYHILQCPYQNTTTIPAPENMEVCVIVNNYREEMKNATTKSPLHTKIKYQMSRKYRGNPKRMTKRLKMPPYMIIVRPVRTRAESNCPYAKLQRLSQFPYYAEHLKIVKKDNSRAVEQQRAALQNLKPPDQKLAGTRENQNILAKVIPITENIEETLEGKDEQSKETNKAINQGEAAMESDEADAKSESDEEYADYDTYKKTSTEDKIIMPTDSVLKYLGTKEAIETLSKHFRDRAMVGKVPKGNVEKYFGEHKDYKQGEKVHGFQNYYHRDEIFNDHIFYDDLQQQGHYSNRGRT
ncbi:uncharacterized protein LOC129253504 [Anastrepha obliqua]|uniref:uncharacterized protein LOC129253504 n=1 Tax=Anastrepha obliqua TaxID=95512 RepID=UPI00240975F4|nr:uncharacterized protein LOC129253504 [Anastrepha obliqua]